MVNSSWTDFILFWHCIALVQAPVALRSSAERSAINQEMFLLEHKPLFSCYFQVLLLILRWQQLDHDTMRWGEGSLRFISHCPPIPVHIWLHIDHWFFKYLGVLFTHVLVLFNVSNSSGKLYASVCLFIGRWICYSDCVFLTYLQVPALFLSVSSYLHPGRLVQDFCIAVMCMRVFPCEVCFRPSSQPCQS